MADREFKCAYLKIDGTCTHPREGGKLKFCVAVPCYIYKPKDK